MVWPRRADLGGPWARPVSSVMHPGPRSHATGPPGVPSSARNEQVKLLKRFGTAAICYSINSLHSAVVPYLVHEDHRSVQDNQVYSLSELSTDATTVSSRAQSDVSVDTPLG